ncbi:MAG: metallophosphoesterase [Deltaproteobacteria bacterium]|nr:metallophosphoesterase [Deltaproteobacteria bacterium]
MSRASRAAWFLAACAIAPPSWALDRLQKGPWLMDLRPDSVVVMAERRRPGRLEVRAVPQGPGGDLAEGVVTARSGVDATLQELTLSGLRPGTRYRYEVSAPDLETATGTFGTAPTTPVPFRFVIYGDTRSQARPHAAVVEAIRREGPEFVVHTGDLVEDGREEDDWQQFFTIEAPLLRVAPFVPVIGNHEIAQPFSNGTDNYRRYVHVAPGGPSTELDSVLRYGNVRFVLANSYEDWSGDARDWLDRELGRQRREGPDDWLFVVMHWGPRSSGPHGDNELTAQAGIDALLRRHRVDLVISGHDHAYERGDDEGLHYLVTGGGGAPLYRRRSARAMSRAFAAEHHYVRVDVEREKVEFTALRLDGTTIDRATLRHLGWSDTAVLIRDRPPPVTAPSPPEVPESPEDWSWIWKVLPVLVLVGVGAWWLRRRQQ